jgi:TadE-like protein
LRFGRSRSPAARDSTAGGSSCRERERERGLAIVEFVLVVPVLLLLLVGIIDFGFLFNDTISVRQSARDGGRQAAVGKFGSDSTCDLYPKFNVTGNAALLFCLTKSRDGIRDKDTRVRLIVGDGTPPPYALGKPVTICEQYSMKSITGMLPFLEGKVFTTRTTFRVEILNNNGGLSDAWEESLPNTDWTSCTAPSVS